MQRLAGFGRDYRARIPAPGTAGFARFAARLAAPMIGMDA